MTPELRAALYAAFEPDDLDIGRKIGILTPVKELTWDELEELEDSSLIYDPETFRYVLPRWLELLSEEAAPSWETDDSTLAFILERRHWYQWPAPQVDSLRRVLQLWGEGKLKEGRMEDFAEFIAPLEEEVALYLDPWVRLRPIEVAQWIWKTRWDRRSSLRRWIVSPRVESKLEDVFFRNPEGEHAELVSNVIRVVRALRSLERGGG